MSASQDGKKSMDADLVTVNLHLETSVAQYNMSISKMVATAYKTSFAFTDQHICLEMRFMRKTLSQSLSEKAFRPLKAGIESGRVDLSERTELGIIIRMRYEHARNCRMLQSKMQKENDDIATIEVLLDEQVPTTRKLKTLSTEDRKELENDWKKIESFLRNYAIVFNGLRTEWIALKMKMENEVQDCIQRVEVILGEETA